jgi:AbrB family looped-hinge helix DNA binding protein
MGRIVRLNGKGRIVIPSEATDTLGLNKGDDSTLETNGNKIVLHPYGIKTRYCK